MLKGWASWPHNMHAYGLVPENYYLPDFLHQDRSVQNLLPLKPHHCCIVMQIGIALHIKLYFYG